MRFYYYNLNFRSWNLSSYLTGCDSLWNFLPMKAVEGNNQPSNSLLNLEAGRQQQFRIQNLLVERKLTAVMKLRPRLDGKFASMKDDDRKEAPCPPDTVNQVVENLGKNRTSMGYVEIDQVTVRAEAGGELEGLVAGGVELGQPDFIEDVRFQ
ncbi:hypothetical protein MA16_Dca016359 [Dendrobium catenatum]|uniref:Uncharacterized protein n=1 Tax=Dendrobium catenatum TaxID=906689 RepID=A0A2I0W344_9ASPA|nr:hypothetical protein MA16_Dca016359 [Dendrobium catenatum]